MKWLTRAHASAIHVDVYWHLGLLILIDAVNNHKIPIESRIESLAMTFSVILCAARECQRQNNGISLRWPHLPASALARCRSKSRKNDKVCIQIHKAKLKCLRTGLAAALFAAVFFIMIVLRCCHIENPRKRATARHPIDWKSKIYFCSSEWHEWRAQRHTALVFCVFGLRLISSWFIRFGSLDKNNRHYSQRLKIKLKTKSHINSWCQKGWTLDFGRASPHAMSSGDGNKCDDFAIELAFRLYIFRLLLRFKLGGRNERSAYGSIWK